MLFSALRVPARILEHPVESVIAGLLLLALLFVSADPSNRGADAAAGRHLSQNIPEKM